MTLLFLACDSSARSSLFSLLLSGSFYPHFNLEDTSSFRHLDDHRQAKVVAAKWYEDLSVLLNSSDLWGRSGPYSCICSSSMNSTNEHCR
ncbi:hypothetical protein DITRI_Ditri01bG0110200 [Diplodiscus trichospermus]